MEEKIVLGTGMAIWVFIAVYILIETRKKFNYWQRSTVFLVLFSVRNANT
jgi:hypothetical protein